jgi:23S rRNA C2498 (ribose-2'-O)-methylase RlmM
MNSAILQQPFFQVALPIMVTLVATVWIAQWPQNKRFDDLRSEITRRFDEVVKGLDRIEQKLDDHEQRLTRVE